MKLFRWFGWDRRLGKSSGSSVGEAQHPICPAVVPAKELTLLSASRNPSLRDEGFAVIPAKQARQS